MSAKHGATESAAWTRELDVILLDGIEDNRQGKDLAHERVKALHPLPQGKNRYPKDFEKWLTKVFEKPSEDGVAPWLSLEFWQHEVDKVLIQGIFARNVTQINWYSESALSGRNFRSHGSVPAWRKLLGQGFPAGWTRRSG